MDSALDDAGNAEPDTGLSVPKTHLSAEGEFSGRTGYAVGCEGTQTTRIIDLAGALVGSNPGLATTYTEQSSSGIEQPRRLNSRARNCLNLLLLIKGVEIGPTAS